MERKKFDKLPTTLEEQIVLLKKRGLKISDQFFAHHCLSTVSYYRLSAYIKHFEADKLTHTLKNNVTFDDNRWFVYKPRFLKELDESESKAGTLKEQIIILILFHNPISLDSSWKNNLFGLFEKHITNKVSHQLMGIDQDWKNDKLWII